jgi:arginyl-tRNA synthetase
MAEMNSVSDKFKEQVATVVARMTNLSVESVFPMLEIPKNEGHGDYSLPVPKLKLPGNPVSIASDLVKKAFCINAVRS